MIFFISILSLCYDVALNITANGFAVGDEAGHQINKKTNNIGRPWRPTACYAMVRFNSTPGVYSKPALSEKQPSPKLLSPYVCINW